MSEITALQNDWTPEDKLDRKISADFLTSYLVKRYAQASRHEKPDTFVLNIRADWGFGKTFFLKRWASDLRNLEHPVVFFDAWENDFSEDPLVGFIASMDDELSATIKKTPVVKQHLDSAMSVGRRLIKPVGLAIGQIIAKKLSGYGLDELKELYSTATSKSDEHSDGSSGTLGGEKSDLWEKISEHADLALKEHLSKRQTIDLFKKRMTTLISELQKLPGIQLPLFVFIDELDRCRPTYAIELLEAIKHLFGVPGIYFVVATNLEQLGHSIRSVYGEQFDSERYLKRFFDQEYLLPDPDRKKFAVFLFNKYSLDDFVNCYPVIEEKYYVGFTPSQALFFVISDAFELSLRDQEQVAAALYAVLANWPERERIHLAYVLFLLAAKQRSTALFKRLEGTQLHNPKSFTEEVSSVLNQSITIKASTRSSEQPNGFRPYVPKDFPVVQLLWAYHELSWANARELSRRDVDSAKFPENIRSALSEDMPRSWSGSEIHDSFLGKYHSRVSQAGQLLSLNTQNQDAK